jgi:gamma-glutamyltranspeptidase
MLLAGGNAVNAATPLRSLTIGAISSGMGSDHFAIIWDGSNCTA